MLASFVKHRERQGRKFCKVQCEIDKTTRILGFVNKKANLLARDFGPWYVPLIFQKPLPSSSSEMPLTCLLPLLRHVHILCSSDCGISCSPVRSQCSMLHMLTNYLDMLIHRCLRSTHSTQMGCYLHDLKRFEGAFSVGVWPRAG